MSSYISFGLVEGSSGQHASGVSLQQDHGLPLAPPLLPGHVSPEMGLKHNRRLTLHAVLGVELTGANPSLEPGKAVLDL